MRHAGNTRSTGEGYYTEGKEASHYANLYFNARNPMMYKRKENHMFLCVLAVSVDVLGLSGVVITDRNAARAFALFKPAPNGLDMIERERVFAEFWTHLDPIEEYEHSGIMCAEVLVPGKVDAHYIFKAYVSCNQSSEDLVKILSTTTANWEIVINGYLFFQ